MTKSEVIKILENEKILLEFNEDFNDFNVRKRINNYEKVIEFLEEL